MSGIWIAFAVAAGMVVIGLLGLLGLSALAGWMADRIAGPPDR